MNSTLGVPTKIDWKHQVKHKGENSSISEQVDYSIDKKRKWVLKKAEDEAEKNKDRSRLL